MVDAAPSTPATLVDAGLRIDLDPDDCGGDVYVISGNTYHHKETLKAHGCRWSKSRGAWTFEGTALIERLSQAFGGGAAAPAPGFAEAPIRFDASRSSPAKSTRPASGTPHFHGHRQRLRGRFRESGGEGMPDYELLELLLFFSIAMSM